MTVAGITVLTWYYTLFSGFSINGLWVDLLLLWIGIVLGQSLGLYVTWRSFKIYQWIAIFYLLIIAVIFGVLTFYPLRLPVFLSP